MINTHERRDEESETSQGVDEDAEYCRGKSIGRAVTVAQNKPKRSYTNIKMRRSFINSEICANDLENVCASNSKSIVASTKSLRFLRNCCFMLSN